MLILLGQPEAAYHDTDELLDTFHFWPQKGEIGYDNPQELKHFLRNHRLHLDFNQKAMIHIAPYEDLVQKVLKWAQKSLNSAAIGSIVKQQAAYKTLTAVKEDLYMERILGIMSLFHLLDCHTMLAMNIQQPFLCLGY